VADVALSLTNQAADHPDLITVTDVTHGNAELWLIGPNSAELLSRLCGLDFHDSQFPNGTAKQSSLAKTTQLIIRRDLGDVPTYALIGGRSLAAYLWQTILEAGQDWGIQPTGLAALRPLTTAD
jgi:heterotetrameric sarcosine oxidase gamma subunit